MERQELTLSSSIIKISLSHAYKHHQIPSIESIFVKEILCKDLPNLSHSLISTLVVYKKFANICIAKAAASCKILNPSSSCISTTWIDPSFQYYLFSKQFVYQNPPQNSKPYPVDSRPGPVAIGYVISGWHHLRGNALQERKLYRYLRLKESWHSH